MKNLCYWRVTEFDQNMEKILRQTTIVGLNCSFWLSQPCTLFLSQDKNKHTAPVLLRRLHPMKAMPLQHMHEEIWLSFIDPGNRKSIYFTWKVIIDYRTRKAGGEQFSQTPNQSNNNK